MEVLIEIELDNSTLRYSRVGVRTPDAYYEPRIGAFGGVKRELSLLPGDYRAASVSVTLVNHDHALSKIRFQKHWYNRKLKVLLLNTATGTVSTAFIGRIEHWSMNNLECSVDAVDAIQQRFTKPLSYLLDSGFFPNTPDETPRNLVPLVVGAVSSPLGAVPAYLIDPAVGQAAYRYVACQGRAASIDQVYAYGALVDSGDYDISYGSGPGGTEVTFIDFDNDERIDGDKTEPHIAWNGSGITDDDTETGNPINNAAEQLVKVLRLNGFDADEIDATSVELAKDALIAAQITGAFVVAEPATVGEVVKQFAESYNLQVFSTSGGFIGMTAPVTNVDPDAELPEVTALVDVVRNSFNVTGPDQVASTLSADYAYNWYLGGFGSHFDRTNSRQVAALGENIALGSVHPFVRNLQAIQAVADAKLFFLREQRQVVNVAVPPHWHHDLEIGELCKLTHFAGIGDNGYQGQVFRVLGMTLEEAGNGTLATFLTLVDITAEPILYVPLGDFSRQPWRLSDYFGKFGLMRGTLRFGFEATGGGTGGGLGFQAIFVGKTIVIARGAIEGFFPPADTITGSTLVTAEGSQRLITSGLTNLWPFHNGSGQTLSDVVGTSHGQFGSGAGSDTNDPSWITAGVRFDGVDNYIQIPTFQNATDGSWTLVLVFKSNGPGAILSQVGGLNQAVWLNHSPAGNLNSTLETTPPFFAAGAITNGVWYMAYLRRVPGLLKINLRRTGSNAANSTTKNLQSVSGGNHFLGINPDLSTGAFDGDMALMGHYNRSLDDAEMTTLFDGVKIILAPRGISL